MSDLIEVDHLEIEILRDRELAEFELMEICVQIERLEGLPILACQQ